MVGIPENFSQPVSNGGFLQMLPTQSPHIMKPVFGTINQQFVQFSVEYMYNEQKSKELNYEHMDAIEICEITNDPKCTVKHTVGNLNAWQRQAFAELYARFKDQKDSLDTEIHAWVAIKPSEKALLEHCGYRTVEQLANAAQEYVARLGPSGKELQERAVKHVNTKGEKVKASDYADQLAYMRQELEAQERRAQDKFDAYVARQAAIAQSEKVIKRRGPRKSKVINEEVSSPSAA